VTTTCDILIVGGGIAGLSVASELSKNAQVVVLEGEDQIGFHSSGRSATMLHYALGNRLIRALTLASRPFFDSPPDGFDEVPLGRQMPVLVHAREDERLALERLYADISPFAAIERLDEGGVRQLCPLLKPDAVHGLADRDGLRLDPHAILQAHLRVLRRNGGAVHVAAGAGSIERSGGAWHVVVARGERYSAPLIVNAAGAWADHVAQLADVEPIGLEPKRRTIITFDGPANIGLETLPFAKTVGDDLYFAPESGRLFASPMDEAPSDPCDAQPDEFEMALAAYRMEQRTTVKVKRIHRCWAGLRTFTSDHHPAVGFASDAEGFFWIAGQGGSGLQTSPALARIVAALILEQSWPLADVSQEDLSPARFFRQAA